MEILKGTVDYLPNVQILRSRIVDVCKRNFELFGFCPAETPILNYFEVLASKYAGGAEILKETYRLQDQGGRDLGLRYDLTVPFARLVGMNRGGTLPAVWKRYEIGRVFRNGPVRTGRMREFTQCDVDVVHPTGLNTAIIDAEFIALAHRVFAELGIPAYCSYNNRKYLGGLLHCAGVGKGHLTDAILAVDKLAKIGEDGVRKEFVERGIDVDCADRFFALSQEETVEGSDMLLEAGAKELASLRQSLEHMKVPADFLKWDPGLARGLEIYTATVFEFFWRADDGSQKPNERMNGSIAAGGRYDRIIGQFLNPDDATKHEEHPACGMSFGLDVITKVFELMQGDKAGRSTVTKVLIFPFGETETGFALQAAAALRDAGVACEVDFSHRKIKHSVEHANKMHIPFHAAVGSNEVAEGKLMLKNLTDGSKGLLTPADAAAKVKAG